MTTSRRTELADFLRTRRERLTPDDVGLPSGGRRRTPGLRREEVALLAGVGVTWYTWLEQGRDINASVQVLEAIARTLRMDSQERWHLFQLAGVTVVAPASPCSGVGEAGQLILDQLDPFPAVVLSPRYEMLAYNRAFNALAGDLDSLDPGERNQLWLFFTHPHWRDICIGRRPEAAAHMVGTMRAGLADHLDDPLWTELVRRLREASPEFEVLWRRHDVVDRGLPAKDFRSPVGDLHLQLQRFSTGELPGGARMMVYTPRDDVTRARLHQLVHHDAAQRLRAV
ncbi:Transcriptional regulator, XRE family [Modestobacter italicus]|uniref:Transcriptional regulator, XRE family n=1 Tax=Modestobacter italicus (strain DSM 44449 / CECT 9708 / BC 501) TaxID=2732864 RepID=I4EV26_MODI5|nr:helix-turn-helix transcriptional regulator [Modestobacter marinus]CCH87239.1 Transcriptional regulator, XRE family [Modestobacter marinus]